MKVIPYMNFNGNAEEAMNFYKKIFGAEIVYTMRYSDNPDFPVSEDYKNKIMHAQLNIDNNLIYVSDIGENATVDFGNHIAINIEFDSVDQIENAYTQLKEEAKEVSMELQDTFWNAKFASLTDKYGIGWSLNYSYPQE